MPDVDPGFGHWMAGLTDGEGSFGIYRSNPNKGLSDWRMTFTIKLRDDDEPTLRLIQQTLGIGSMGHCRDKRGLANPTAKWQVGARAELLVIVELFDAYPLRARKAEAYAVWREALLTARGDWARMAIYREQLTQAQMYAGSPQRMVVALAPTLFDRHEAVAS